jgi:hypothetical protein
MAQDRCQDGIPVEVATQLCRQIQAENRGKWFSWKAWWCWGCRTFTGGNSKKMCFYSPPDHRGCAQVNRRYEQQ